MDISTAASTRSVTCRAVLFDMDGTLVDSTSVVEHVWSEFALRHGLDYAKILHTSHGVQAIDMVRRFAPAGADVLALTAELGTMERSRVAGIVPIPGVPELLASLPSEAIALVTSADRTLAELRMNAAGVAMPATAVTADTITRGKPHPEGYLKAAGVLGIEPADALVFEDAPAGIAAALAAGMRTVAIGPNTGRLPDGMLHIHDYTSVHTTLEKDSTGARTITFRF